MIDRENAFHRVFFHELGHFIAHIINEKYHSGQSVSEFTIVPEGNDFSGHIKLLPLAGQPEDELPPLNRLVSYVLSVEHGCLFEAYLTESSIGDCVRLHGKWDYSLRREILGHYNLFGYSPQLSGSVDKYLIQLKTYQVLKSLLDIKPECYLRAESATHFNHEKLAKDLEEFVRQYEHFYEAEHNKLAAILCIDQMGI